MAFNSILPLLHTNCRMCGQTVHYIDGNSRALRSRQLNAPLVTTQNGLISKQLAGAVVDTQFGSSKPILHGGTTRTDCVPIKNSIEDSEKNCRFSKYHNGGEMHSQASALIQVQHSDVTRDHSPYNKHFSSGQPGFVQVRKFVNSKPNEWGEGKYNTNTLLSRKEICYVTYHLFAHHRDYYIDLKENRMGMYIKMIEIDPSLYPRFAVVGKIFMQIHSVFELRRYLDEFHVFFNMLNINPCKPNDICVLQGHPIKSEVIFSSNRRYYLDLVTNKKGSCLKIKQTTIPNGPCSSLVIGAAGLKHFYEAITDMLTKFVTRGSLVRSLPQPLKVDGVKEFDSFYFDVGQNEAGVYLRISKMGKDKTVITVPMESWSSFHDLFDSYIVKMKEFRDMQAYQ